MITIACPSCGETDRIGGSRDGDLIAMSCGACGHQWSRDTSLHCKLCGSHNLHYTPKPLWEKGRGQQRTPAGRFDAYSCYDCGGVDVIAKPGETQG